MERPPLSTLVELPPSPPERPPVHKRVAGGVGRVAGALLLLVFALGVLFLFLTRTEVGRGGLRREVERQFAARFKGRVEIGRLKGNLLNDLYALLEQKGLAPDLKKVVDETIEAVGLVAA